MYRVQYCCHYDIIMINGQNVLTVHIIHSYFNSRVAITGYVEPQTLGQKLGLPFETICRVASDQNV